MQLPFARACGAIHAFMHVHVLVMALVLVLGATLAGCAPAEAPPAAPRTQVAQGGAGALILPDLMDLLVDPAAGVLLAAAELQAGGDAEPQAAEAWQAMADAAVQLAQVSEILAQPALALGRSDWMQLATALREGAAAGGAAAARHDAWALVEAGARIRTTCRACHALYAPEPTDDSASRLQR